MYESWCLRKCSIQSFVRWFTVRPGFTGEPSRAESARKYREWTYQVDVGCHLSSVPWSHDPRRGFTSLIEYHPLYYAFGRTPPITVDLNRICTIARDIRCTTASFNNRSVTGVCSPSGTGCDHSHRAFLRLFLPLQSWAAPTPPPRLLLSVPPLLSAPLEHPENCSRPIGNFSPLGKSRLTRWLRSAPWELKVHWCGYSRCWTSCSGVVLTAFGYVVYDTGGVGA